MDEEYYLTRSKAAIQQTHETARVKLKTSQEYMKRDYDIKMKKTEYQPGNLVYNLQTAQIKDRNKKLDPPWKGPGIVAVKVTSYVYKVKLEMVIITINHDRMKKCFDKVIQAWLKMTQSQ